MAAVGMERMSSTESEGEEPVDTSPQNPRKRKRNVDNWKRTREKRQRHAGDGCIPTVTCKHVKNTDCAAHQISREDLRKAHDNFYKDSDKARQDSFILKNVEAGRTNRHRPKNEATSRQRDTVYTYYVSTDSIISVYS